MMDPRDEAVTIILLLALFLASAVWMTSHFQPMLTGR